MSKHGLFVLLVAAVIMLNVLPAWNIHVVPKLIRDYFAVGRKRPVTAYEMFQGVVHEQRDDKEIGLLLKKRFGPSGSIVLGRMGQIGYYSGLRIFDRYGLVDRRVATLPQGERPLRAPGHDKRVGTDFFFPEKPTIILHETIIEKGGATVGWQAKILAGRFRDFSLWDRCYGVVVLPMRPSPDGYSKAQFLIRLVPQRTGPSTPYRALEECKKAGRVMARREWNSL